MSTQHNRNIGGVTCCARFATLLRRVGSCSGSSLRQQHASLRNTNLSQMVKFGQILSQQHAAFRNTSQQGDQTRATCCAQQCCDMLCWHVAIVYPGQRQRDCQNVLMITCDQAFFFGERKQWERRDQRLLFYDQSEKSPDSGLWPKDSWSNCIFSPSTCCEKRTPDRRLARRCYIHIAGFGPGGGGGGTPLCGLYRYVCSVSKRMVFQPFWL